MFSRDGGPLGAAHYRNGKSQADWDVAHVKSREMHERKMGEQARDGLASDSSQNRHLRHAPVRNGVAALEAIRGQADEHAIVSVEGE